MDAERIHSAFKVVANQLGYTSVKAEQVRVVTNFVMGNDVFAVLPTGFGKSLCYACLPGVFDNLSDTTNSVVVVLSPLVSIIKDQVGTY